MDVWTPYGEKAVVPIPSANYSRGDYSALGEQSTQYKPKNSLKSGTFALGDVQGGEMSGLSTRHLVLGLLVERAGYGYDLQQRIDARLGFLGLSESAVYKILERLETEGWIEEVGPRRIGITRRGAPRVIYRATPLGHERFKEWMAAPCERVLLRDELQAKLNVAEPADLPQLLAIAEAQSRTCLRELAELGSPVITCASEPTVPWRDAATMMVDDFRLRSLQTLVAWLDSICVLIAERIRRTSEGDALDVCDEPARAANL
jgi:DNA-binding PadR family transcriptional regulator